MLIVMRWVWLSRILVRRHRPATVRMDGLTTHVDGWQGQPNAGRDTRTIDAQVYRWHTYQPCLAGDAKQASGLGGKRAGSFKTWSGNVPL